MFRAENFRAVHITLYGLSLLPVSLSLSLTLVLEDSVRLCHCQTLSLSQTLLLGKTHAKARDNNNPFFIYT